MTKTQPDTALLKLTLGLDDEQACFEAYENEHDRCISQVGNKPGGTFYCDYQNLTCYDACEGIGYGLDY